ncbi:MAG TPA: rhamnulokinase family protein [Kiritimatiellia bacterium]|nr:rhamnulokinase family protein [Kiritimatiellia bacterium]HMO99690.1 rhamnulokinase family protein [Kiritimatiellia bacterium]
MNKRVYVAIDLGASGGRVIAGWIEDGEIKLDILHRFDNGPVFTDGVFRWPWSAILDGIRVGMMEAGRRFGAALRSVGVDTWGVDYGLVDCEGRLRSEPVAYRDTRTDGMMEQVFAQAPRDEVYRITGIQFLGFNTLYQLMAERNAGEGLGRAEHLLFIPDLIHAWLSGVAVNEYTIASTSQMLDVQTRDWSSRLLNVVGAPRRLFPRLVMPGDVIGTLRSEWARAWGIPDMRVVAPPSHDTASAVVAVPFVDSESVYLSSGTWSLMGVELPEPMTGEAAYRYGFTNEGGAYHTIRLLKNICGMWIIQECRKAWMAGGEPLSFEQIRAESNQAPPFVSFIDPDDPVFATPGDMPARIQAYCRETGQPVPLTRGAMARCVFESLAMRYRAVLGMLEDLTGRTYQRIHIVGGGAMNEVVNQYTAEATGREVEAGPVEATSLGNLAVQMISDGVVADLAEARAMIRRSTDLQLFAPRQPEIWRRAYEGYIKATAATSRL